LLYNAQVSLFANSQLVGTTTSAANGTWQIVTAAMADGVYDVSAKVQSASGTILTRSWGALVVDTIAPEVVVNGLVDGVAWTPQTAISGVIADPDAQLRAQLRVEYQINSDGTTAVSAVMGATIDAPTSTPTLTRQNLTQTTLNFGNLAPQSTFKPYDVVFKVTDRAGNITTQNYKGMVLNRICPSHSPGKLHSAINKISSIAAPTGTRRLISNSPGIRCPD
jgi:hypothetical protein